MQGREKIEISERHLINSVSSANLAVSAVTQNAVDRSKIALVCEGLNGSRQIYSFFEIEQFSNRIANVLNDLNVKRSDRIFTLLNRQPTLYAAIPAILKLGAAAAILFTDFGAEAIRQRVEDAGAKILLVEAEHLSKIAPICEFLPTLEHILVVGKFDRKNLPQCPAQFQNFDELVKNASAEFAPVEVSPDDTFFLIYTYGTTPTLLRLLRNEIGDVSPKKEFVLRRIYSVGEPLNPEVSSWAEQTFGAEVFDSYWQTETGSFIIANRPNIKKKRGAMGKAVDGVEVSIIDNQGSEVPNGTIGDIAIRPTLTSLFRGYWNFPEATRVCFRAVWYITRDKGKRDDDGYFWFTARNDDVITCEAQRIGPFEVENALLSQQLVAESAAVGAKDEMTTEHVKAFVVLRNDFEASATLANEIAAHVRGQLSPLAAPREIEFCSELPKTKSGKIRRDQLRRKGKLDAEKVYIIG